MRTEQLKFLGILAVVSLLVTSCWFMGPWIKGNGRVTEEVRELDGFDEIEVSRGMNVFITQGSPTKVVVIADNNLHEVIETDVDGDVLKVYVSANIRDAEEKKVMITVDKLTKVKSTSGSNIYSQNRITTEDIELSANAGSNITMEFDAEHLQAECSSGANLKGESLKSDRCKMRASGGGNVYASVVEQVEAEASSGGNITYYGDPKETDINSSSGGNIHHR